jgi:hypothetical protein
MVVMAHPPNSTIEARSRSPLAPSIALAASMVATFTALRLWLTATPNSDFNVLGYNIHHLFTGILIVVAAAIPLATGVRSSRWRLRLTILLGVGLGLVLDEWVYLIVTDGSNASYLLPESFYGGLFMIALAAVYAVLAGVIQAVKARRLEPMADEG